jgi:ABC-type multidrug transport system fused ATPase/permease subunit
MFWSAVKLLLRTIKYYLSINPLLVITKEFSHIIRTLINIYSIFVAGKFIDGTVFVLGEWDVFTFKEYMLTDSFFYLLLGLILFCIARILTGLSAYLDIILDSEFYFKADLDILGKMSSTNLQEVEEKEFQDLINYVPNYSTTSFMQTIQHLSNALIQLITFLGSFVMLATIIGWSSFLIILFVLPETIILFIRNDQVRRYIDSSIGKVKYMNYVRLISTRVPDFPELRVTGVFKFLKKFFKKKGRDYYSHLLEKYFHLHTDQTLFSVVDQILLTGYIVYILAISVVKGISIGQFSALVNYARTGYAAAYHFINHLFTIVNNLSYIKNFFKFLDYEGFGDVPFGYEKLPKGCPTLKFVSLDFAYPKTKEKVLEGINLEIKPGEKVAFVGSSGSGKSSLVRILCGLFKITAGDYVVGGYSIRELARGQLKSKIAVVFQDFVRYNFSLKRNILIGNRNPKVNKSLYEKSKMIAGVDKFTKRLKIADEQLLGKFLGAGNELSPGHWQRLAIARMIYRNKEIMIMDEPFTFIDGPSKAEILDGIMEFVGDNRILIYITQDTDNLNKFDRVYYFKKGKIVEQGKAKDLLEKKGHFYKEAKFNR